MPTTLNVVLTMTEELLGTMAANPELYREFIASRHPDGEQADEVEASERVDVDEEVERSSTVFPRDAAEARPFLWDYQIKGFFKDACGMLRRADGTESKKIKAYKKEIDGLIFVTAGSAARKTTRVSKQYMSPQNAPTRPTPPQLAHAQHHIRKLSA